MLLDSLPTILNSNYDERMGIFGRNKSSGQEDQAGGWAAGVVQADQQRLEAEQKLIQLKKLELVIGVAEKAIETGDTNLGREPITSWISVLEEDSTSQTDPAAMNLIGFLNEAIGERERAGYWYKRAADGEHEEAVPGMARVLTTIEFAEWVIAAVPTGNRIAKEWLHSISEGAED